MKYTKEEKEEQFRKSMDEGAFETQAGRDALIRAFMRVIDRHHVHE